VVAFGLIKILSEFFLTDFFQTTKEQAALIFKNAVL